MVMTTRPLLILFAAPPLLGQRETTFETRPALIVENNKLELVIMSNGGAFTSLTLKDDPPKRTPCGTRHAWLASVTGKGVSMIA